MTQIERAEAICLKLKEIYPDATCALESGGDPFRLLVMARLSARCTDRCVNEVSPGLFAVYPDVSAMANADQTTLESLIRPCGLYRTKAEHLIAMSKMLLAEHGGNVPSDMDALLRLPGIGRKIANLVRGDIFGLGGIVADTHCMRISGRLGLVEEGTENPEKTERALTPLIPTEQQSDFCHRLVFFGRDVCSSRSPRCASCPLLDLCLSKERHRE